MSESVRVLVPRLLPSCLLEGRLFAPGPAAAPPQGSSSTVRLHSIQPKWKGFRRSLSAKVRSNTDSRPAVTRISASHPWTQTSIPRPRPEWTRALPSDVTALSRACLSQRVAGLVPGWLPIFFFFFFFLLCFLFVSRAYESLSWRYWICELSRESPSRNTWRKSNCDSCREAATCSCEL
jgi:hypothetical protein